MHSDCPCSLPVLLVKMKSEIRFCIDYRRLNAVTRNNAYPLPRVDDVIRRLTEAKLFSSLDFDSIIGKTKKLLPKVIGLFQVLKRVSETCHKVEYLSGRQRRHRT